MITGLLKSRFSREAKIVARLKPLLLEYRPVIVLLVMLGALASLAEGIGISLFIPLLYSLELESLQPQSDSWLGRLLEGLLSYLPQSDKLAVICLGIFLLVLLKNLLSFATALLFGLLDARLAHRLRCKVFDQLLDVGIQFIDRHETGRLLNVLENETWSTSSTLATLVQMTIIFFNIVLFTLLLLLISWKLTLVVVVIAVAISLVVQLLARRVEALSHSGLRAWTTLSQATLEAFRGMKTIRLFGHEALEKQKFRGISQTTSRVYLDLEVLSNLVAPLSEILGITLVIVIMYTALQEPGNLPAVLTFVVILSRLQPLMQQMDNDRLSLIASTASVEAVVSFLRQEDKPYLRSGSVPFSGLGDAVSFRSVSFCYEGADRPALQEISVRVPKNKTTALVGPSGAGKSTFINLLVRFYDPLDGTVYVDETPLQELDLNAWRRHIAVVHQDVHLFNTTVKKNIAYGRPEATAEEIIDAARQAAADEFIRELPQGYDTRVGDLGVRLSGGQRQRIALARAIVRDPEILILDEATNALDSISENLIQEALNVLSRRRTIIMIAHRLATIERADQIIVMDQGHIKEQGTLAELLQRQGLFAKLYQLQHQNAYEQ